MTRKIKASNLIIDIKIIKIKNGYLVTIKDCIYFAVTMQEINDYLFKEIKDFLNEKE